MSRLIRRLPWEARRRRTRLGVPLVAAALVAGGISLAAPAPGVAPGSPPSPAPYRIQPGHVFRLKPAILAAREALKTPTDFRISTFNALGNSHTSPGGDQPGYASGVTRMRWAWQLLGGAGVDVIGFQEFQTPQVNAFRALTAGAYDVYPGTSLGAADAENSIAWRNTEWSAVETDTESIPYFGGHLRQMPYVLLRNLTSGQEVWFVNVHNPADKFGAAGQYRARATALESALIDRLNADGTPVLLTGDMNDRETAYCSLTATTDLAAANGGSSLGGCRPPPDPLPVDWIFGTPQVQFTGYTRVSTGLINRTTDHPFVWAQVHLDPSATQP